MTCGTNPRCEAGEPLPDPDAFWAEQNRLWRESPEGQQQARELDEARAETASLPFLLRGVCQGCRSGFHGKCTDPFGDRSECPCYALDGAGGRVHRLIHEQWQPESPDPGDGDDDRSTSRAGADFEYQQARFEDYVGGSA